MRACAGAALSWRALAGLACAALASGTALSSPARADAAAWLPDGARRPAAWIVEIDGRIAARHAETARRQPASLAKLAAAIVVAEAAQADPALLDQDLSVSVTAARADGTRLGLSAGDRVAVGAMLAAMLVGSANDACLALAEHLAGNGTAFAHRMNRLATRLDMVDTRFVDPCGFDRPGQHTTAADLLRLARRALAEPLIVAAVQRRMLRVRPTGGTRALEVRNTNALLDRYDGAFGLKTGYTRQAGPGIVATVRRDGLTAIAVVLGAQDRWPVTVALLDEAFDRATGIPRLRSRAAAGDPDD